MSSRWLRIVISFVFALSAVWAYLRFGISPKGRPSALVIAVESVSPESFACNSEEWPLEMEEVEAVNVLCLELIRFNRAFATSTLAAPTMGSVLTGFYPFQTGLRHAGGGPNGYLRDSVETVAEVAHSLGYRTGMWTSGPTLGRRHGLSQGFEVFDDFNPSAQEGVFRPARQQLRLFQRWLGQLDSSEPFFSVIHFSDLLFRSFALSDEEGYVEPTVQRKVADLWSSIAKMKRGLQAKGLWDQTLVIIVGLGGEADRFDRDFGLTHSLTTESTRVPLYIKPLKEVGVPENQGKIVGRPDFEWTPEEKVRSQLTSLVDLGVTLRQLLLGQHAHDQGSAGVGEAALKSDHLLYPQSLLPLSQNERATGFVGLESGNRWILSESAWMNWLLKGSVSIRAAVRSPFYTAIYDEPIIVYEPAADPFEASPISSADHRANRFAQHVSVELSRLGFSQLTLHPKNRSAFLGLIEFEALAAELLPKVIKLGFLERMNSSNSLADHLIGTGKQRSVSVETDPSVLVRRLVAPATELGSSRMKSCRNALFQPHMDLEVANVCGGSVFVEMKAWHQATDESERSKVVDRIAKIVRQAELTALYSELGMALGVRWEVGSRLNTGIETWETLLSAPENTKLRQAIMRRLRASASRRPTL